MQLIKCNSYNASHTMIILKQSFKPFKKVLASGMYDSYNRVSEEKRPFKTVNQTINHIYKKRRLLL